MTPDTSPTPDPYLDVLRQITEQTGVAFAPASPKDLAALHGLNFPDPVIAFYAAHAPTACVEGDNIPVRLWPIDHLELENRQAVPGLYLLPHGYRVFASTFSGDAYCFNLNQTSYPEGDPEIVLLSHEVIHEDTPAKKIHRLAKPVAPNLLTFLTRFQNNTLDQDCLYR